MVVGYGVDEGDMLPLDLPGGSIDWVSEFRYLGSLIAESGRAHEEVDRRIASAFRAFGALRQPIFEDPDLSITTKRYIYEPVSYQCCCMEVSDVGCPLSET